MKTKTNSKPAYSWAVVKEKILKGTSYPTGFAFNYRFQLRIKSTPNALFYTFWDFSKCTQSGAVSGTETVAWPDLFNLLKAQGILDVPCVGVGVSVWNDLPLLLRLEKNAAVSLDVINSGLRTQPETIRRDLQSNGIYGFTALECDTTKLFIFGIPLGYTIKEQLSKFPESWSKVIWSGPTAVPMWQAFSQNSEASLYHTVLLKNTSISLMTQGGKIKFLQQDRGLVEDQPITQGSLTKLRSVYNYFPPGEIKHLLYPVEASITWVGNLRTSIQDMRTASDVQIVAPAKLKYNGIDESIMLQDMFPTGLPWT